MSTKKHTLRVTILNEEFAIRSDRPPEHGKAVATYFDQAIRKVMQSGGVVETNRAVVLAALQITAELFDARAAIDGTEESIKELSEYVRPLLPPSKRQASA
jgi:cell division protein ZapA (FtsZ GTPase activity inhibitor)